MSPPPIPTVQIPSDDDDDAPKTPPSSRLILLDDDTPLPSPNSSGKPQNPNSLPFLPGASGPILLDSDGEELDGKDETKKVLVEDFDDGVFVCDEVRGGGDGTASLGGIEKWFDGECEVFESGGRVGGSGYGLTRGNGLRRCGGRQDDGKDAAGIEDLSGSGDELFMHSELWGSGYGVKRASGLEDSYDKMGASGLCGLHRDKEQSGSGSKGFPRMAGEEGVASGYCSDKDTSLQEVRSGFGNGCNATEGTKKKKGRRVTVNSDNRKQGDEELARKKQIKEGKELLKEEQKRKREEKKVQREAAKAEAAEMKKLQKEKEKWEKGKFALKYIVAGIDPKLLENGTIGGYLLSKLAEKDLSFRVTKNTYEKSIFWKMFPPEQLSPLSPQESQVRYVLFVYEAEEFCSLVTNNTLLHHVCEVQKQYPSFTICYLTNKLMSYISKREQYKYKNPTDGWKRPPVEEVSATITTNFTRVRLRHCIDEAEIAEHIVGLTTSLAACEFRTKLTWLSVNANGGLVPKGFIDKGLIKKSPWLKALVAIPKVQPRFAVAISKKYPTMRSLLNVYMDHNKSVHEKEFLLKDLMVEGETSKEGRRLGEVCSKRVYRILMARNGGIITDEVEDGADFFT